LIYYQYGVSTYADIYNRDKDSYEKKNFEYVEITKFILDTSGIIIDLDIEINSNEGLIQKYKY